MPRRIVQEYVKARHSKETFQLFTMTWPIVIELLLTGIINTGSQYYLNLYSPDAVAVVGSLSQVVSFIINLYTLISIGGSIMLAPMVGAGRSRECGKLIHTMVRGNVIFALVISAISLLFMNPFMRMMGIDPSLYGMGREYLLVCLGLSTAQSLLITYTAIFRSFGHMTDVLFANFSVYIVCFFVNVGIYRLIPLQHQHLMYYTMAGIVGQMTGTVYMMVRLHRFFFSHLEPADHTVSVQEMIAYLKRILFYGIPAGMEGIVYLIGQMVLIAMVGSLGTQALLVKSYVGIFAGYMVIVTSAINASLFVLVGQHLGEKNAYAIRKTFRVSVQIGVIVAFVIGLLFAICAVPLTHIFTQDAAVVESVKYLLWVQLVIELLRVLAAFSVSGLKAIGETKIPFVMVVLGSLLNIIVSFVCGIVLHMGIYGIWYGYIADLLLRGGVEGFIFKKRTTDEAIAKDTIS